MHTITIVCRSSKLAIAQAHRAEAAIRLHAADIHVRTVTKESAGDKNRSVPIYTMEERDVFTKDIDEYLLSGEADFAVHSLKDLSLERTEDPRFVSAVFERDDPRDIALFKGNVMESIASGKTLIIGTSSLRRTELAPPFLHKALPQIHGNAPLVRCESIRGNVDSRLHQLATGDYDGIIIAAAGLNRLLAVPEHLTAIRNLLDTFRMMVLPLVEFPPAPAQGALIIEALSNNERASSIIEHLRSPSLEEQISSERALLRAFGGGCHQRFGGISLQLPSGNVLITGGKAKNGEDVANMRFAVPNILAGKALFTASDFMQDFFTTSYEATREDFSLAEEVVFVSHHRAVHHEAVLRELRQKRVWTAGTRTWFELAKRCVWVEGCSDGFGFRFLADVFHSPLVGINTGELRLLTNTDSAEDWEREGVAATGLYTLHENVSASVIAALPQAEAYFWTSFGQYQACRPWLREGALHLCPSGKTAEKFRSAGIEPIIFPSIKAFLLWHGEQK